jgi:hypothetical protein
MRNILVILLGSFLLLSTPVIAGEEPLEARIVELQQALNELRDSYETRLVALEQRLQVAEQRVVEQADEKPTAAGSTRLTAAAGSDNSFNPAIGVIFQGQAWDYQRNPDNYEIPGFPLGGEAGPVAEGLSLGETEIDISANVDDKFTAWLTLPVVIEDGETVVEVEEAWIETLALPGGVSARFGRFFSNIGYLNSKHSHSWDFVDQPLAYQAFLGNQYIDDGVQLRWLAPTDFYLELGGELMRGDRYPAGGAADSGFGSHSLFARTGGDVGMSHSWQAGLSYLDATSNGRESGAEDEPLVFSGDSELLIAEFIWKWAPNGNARQRNFKLQAEYLHRDEQGLYELPAGDNHRYDASQDGWYVQAIYQPVPRWRVGGRIDALNGDYAGSAFAGTPLDTAGVDPRRYSFMLDWSNSEFSRIRLQYTHDDATFRSDNQWGLQYIHSIGAHGAHSF